MVRAAVREAMGIMSSQFVLGRTIDEALANAARSPNERHSFDMLGEGALTAADANAYFDQYVAAITAVGRAADGRGPIAGPGVSVKLSALHSRFSLAQADRVRRELGPRLIELARLAKSLDIALTVDAEEAARLEISLELIDAAARDSTLAGWDGFGLAVQAYQSRSLAAIDRLAEIAGATGRRLMVRLVKGAYWDTEIKRAQENGLDRFPVLTRKVSTDVSYLACASKLIAAPRAFFPCFATHNAHTAAAVAHLADRAGVAFEYQRLHGMGGALYEAIAADRPKVGLRVYAPVGGHEDLLAYLVRRLLENGANTSFVNRLTDASLPLEAIVADPTVAARGLKIAANPRIAAPADLFLPERRHSRGIDLDAYNDLTALKRELDASAATWNASAIIAGRQIGARSRTVTNPANHGDIVGEVAEARPENALAALTAAAHAHPAWSMVTADRHAAILDKAADAFEHRRGDFMALAVREAGKTISDALGEVREAVDFLRYYAARARADFMTPRSLPGPTGETNRLSLHGRGVFLCISP
ncbi:MAG: aldehyde dehydrogenase family protein [Alphaproteobacteria bacterium]|nr:aldehyde dehydrogenase family protein [Alphaproteobacteria bacterium]